MSSSRSPHLHPRPPLRQRILSGVLQRAVHPLVDRQRFRRRLTGVVRGFVETNARYLRARIGKIASLSAVAIVVSIAIAIPAQANETLASSEALIACINEEPDVYACARPFICQPDHAFFHRHACAEKAAIAAEGALQHFQSELQPVLSALDARFDASYAAAELEAQVAWEAYRDANCRGDRTAALDGIGLDEARNYCLVRHAISRLAVIRADLDRFRFKLAAEE